MTRTDLYEDLLLTFQTDFGALRGRFCRLGPTLDSILARHAYPTPVAALLGETMALASVLAGSLKYDGVFTLQIQAEGPVGLMVADVTSQGALRAYARHDEHRLAEALALGQGDASGLLGKGLLAFTVDQGAGMDRYQGLVELTGRSLSASALEYFRRSEQIDTAIRLAVRPPGKEGRGWRAGAVMIQRMPAGGGPIHALSPEQVRDRWETAQVLLDSLTDKELLDPALAPERLLYRLYHASGLVVHDARPLRDRCRCSRSRVAGTLASFPKQEILSMKDDKENQVVVTCEFCKTVYRFSDADLEELYV